MKKSIIPRFGFSKVAGEIIDVDNLQVAATIYAFDIPLNKSNPYDTQAGDGINGVRVVWHFEQSDAAGNSPKQIATKFFDPAWVASNPTNPLAVCRKSFDHHADLKRAIKSGQGFSYYGGAACRVTNTRKAAVMLALGHKLLGWQRNDTVTTWCFHEVAAADAALYDSDDLYVKLPDANISYAKGAILGHEQMLSIAKTVQHARITHRGRTAMIGRDMPQDQINVIEKLLYRK